jgi:hypothetical protein
VALLVFAAAAARTRIVAPDSWFLASYRRAFLVVVRALRIVHVLGGPVFRGSHASPMPDASEIVEPLVSRHT